MTDGTVVLFKINTSVQSFAPRLVLPVACLLYTSYQKRFILEKESRIANLMDNKKLFSDDVIDIEFTEK